MRTSDDGGITILVKNTLYYATEGSRKYSLVAELCGVKIVNLRIPLTIISCYKLPGHKLTEQ